MNEVGNSQAFLESIDLSESTKKASQLYARSLLADMISFAPRKLGKHNKARALRAKARITNRKAKRKA